MDKLTEGQQADRMAELEKAAYERIGWEVAYEYLTDEEREEYDRLADYI